MTLKIRQMKQITAWNKRLETENIVKIWILHSLFFVSQDSKPNFHPRTHFFQLPAPLNPFVQKRVDFQRKNLAHRTMGPRISVRWQKDRCDRHRSFCITTHSGAAHLSWPVIRVSENTFLGFGPLEFLFRRFHQNSLSVHSWFDAEFSNVYFLVDWNMVRALFHEYWEECGLQDI